MGQGCEVPRLRGNDGGGLILGPIWPWLASFTPSSEAENEATVALVGTPLTRTRQGSLTSLWPWLASSGVRRSGEPFISVAFGCISCRPNPHPRLDSSLRWNDGDRGQGCEVLVFAGTTGCFRIYDAYNQCKGARDDGATGVCRRISFPARAKPRRPRIGGRRALQRP